MTRHDKAPSPPGSDRQFDLNASVGQATPVIRLVNLIVLEALKSGSAQVHLHAGTLTVRYLRDEAWIPVMKLPSAVIGPTINRLRVMAGLDRTKGKTRQEGALEVVADGAPVCLQIQVQFIDTGDEEVYLHLPTNVQE